ncbi:unnamed protein product, partial [Musa textilis]
AGRIPPINLGLRVRMVHAGRPLRSPQPCHRHHRRRLQVILHRPPPPPSVRTRCRRRWPNLSRPLSPPLPLPLPISLRRPRLPPLLQPPPLPLWRYPSSFEPAPTTRAEVLCETPNPVAEAEDEHQQQHHFGRSQSDAQPTAGEMPPKLPVRIKKSASEKSAFAHFEEAEVEEAGWDAVETEGSGGGDEVDARADDFINRFRQQLRLQRLESIARYKEMLSRGS